MEPATLSREELVQRVEESERIIAGLRSAEARIEEMRAALQQSEERYRTAFECTGTAMMVVEEDTTVSMWNHRLEQVTGYTDEYAMAGRKWPEFVAEDDRARMMEYHRLRRTDPDSVPGEYEFRLKHRSGEFRDILMNVGMIPGTRKSLISLTDITGRKSMEKALRYSEQRYRELFENANDAIFTIDLDGRFLNANDLALATWEYDRESFSSATVYDIVDPEYHHVIRDKMEQKKSGELRSAPYEVLSYTKGKRPVWVEVTTRLLHDPQGDWIIMGIARNITERKRAEQKLRDSERRFRETADLLPGIICESDVDLRFTYTNTTGMKTIGYTQEEFDRGITVLDIVIPADLQRAKHDIRNVLGGDFGTPAEYTIQSKGGRTFDLLVNTAPIKREGIATGLRYCIVDITDRKKAERELRASEERFRSIYAHSPIGIGLFDREGNPIDMNHSFRRMFFRGAAPIPAGEVEEAYTVPILDPAEFNLFEITALTQEQRRVLESGDTLEHHNSIGQGAGNENRTRHLEWHITPISQDEREQFVFVQVQDVTAQKQAEEDRLRRSREEVEKARMVISSLRRELRESAGFQNMVSRSPLMKKVFDILPEVARSSATVLVTGESGTGKELVARSLHALSSRSGKPFVAINCSALPDNLLESELFGYRAGAFTDAKKDKPGRFAAAEGGTVFLDEIGDITGALQVKLLRFLQEKTYEPLGATHSIKADVRVVAATNKNLQEMVRKGTFREDLFYRLNIVSIHLPPLRERRCDIPLLCTHFITGFNSRYAKSIKGMSEPALECLLRHSFPGNIREMQNIIEHAFIFCKDEEIGVVHLPDSLQHGLGEDEPARVLTRFRSFDDLERLYIKGILEENEGSRSETAKRLGIDKSTLFRKMKKLGLGSAADPA